MTHEQQYIVEKFNLETILSIKYQLMKDQLLEPVLSTNLDYAARVIPHMPHAILSEATLCIAGESVLVKLIRADKQFGSKINFTVICNDGQPQLIRRVTCGDVITHSDVKDAHFSGHNCQDMVQSCSEQARALVSKGNRKMLHIICNSLSLTYSTGYDAEDGQSPQTTQHSAIDSHILKTECRLTFPDCCNIERLLKMKCWIEQEKPQKRGLIACVDHLLKQFTELPKAPYSGCTFILQSGGEMVKLLDKRGDEYYIFVAQMVCPCTLLNGSNDQVMEK
ncbi:hypothetical protein ANANG_G00119190 [Anguilla anguilla]|uniref:Uncharacterized protein n=1 Tax=Anguilla anguilla TaxID=7936 RepID=A0A9D3MDY4_ANGAN|nr:hypothetical protein ANANG_G00119190 [Anguilla anguilla]